MNVELIKAIAALWPLTLIIFLAIVAVVFRRECRSFISNLKNLQVRRGKTEISVNQPSEVPLLSPSTVTPRTPATIEPPKVNDDTPESSRDSADQPELNLSPELRPWYYFMQGEPDKAKQSFEILQSETEDPERRVWQEADYLELCYTKGDLEAQTKLQQLEARAHEFPKVLGYVQRVQGRCFNFARQYDKAAERFLASVASCVTEKGKAESVSLAASAMWENKETTQAYDLLKGQLIKLAEPSAKVILYGMLAELFKKDGDTVSRALALQRALSFQPNSQDRLFDTAYSLSEADLDFLAVLHYEQLTEVNYKSPGGHNNLGVAYGQLGLRVCEVESFQRAVANDSTLAAANLAKILIPAGLVREADKLIGEAAAKKDVDSQVGQTKMQLQNVRESADTARTAVMSVAGAAYQFLLGYADALLSPQPEMLPLGGGQWRDEQEQPIEFRHEEKSGSTSLIWNEVERPERLRFSAQFKKNVARGTVSIWRSNPLGSLAAVDKDGFETYGQGFAYYQTGAVNIFVWSKEHRIHRRHIFKVSPVLT